MAEQIKLTVTERPEKGKGPSHRLREENTVPGVFYDQHGLNIPVAAKDVPLSKVYKKVGRSQVFDLEIEREGETVTKKCLIWQVQYHPVKSNLSHVDFFSPDMDNQIKVWVPLHVTGKSVGEKAGGRLEVFKESIQIQALPGDIPRSVSVDITNLDINDSIHVTDLVLPEGATAIYDNNFAILTILAKGVELSEEEEEGGAEEAVTEEASEE